MGAKSLRASARPLLVAIIVVVVGAPVAFAEPFRIARPVPDRFPLNGAYLYAETNFGYPHCGVDILVGMGDSVYSVCNGVVVAVDYEPEGFGKYVCVRGRWNGKFVWFYYAHLSRNDFVAVGDSVDSGQLIGLAGSTGFSTGPHLHFEIRVGTPHPGRHRNRRNPELWFAMHGTGAIYGHLPNDPGGTRVDVYPDPKPRPPYVNYAWSVSYTFDGKIGSDDLYHENWAVGDVVPGTYVITAQGGSYRRVVTVPAGQVVNADASTRALPRQIAPFPGDFTLLAAAPNPFSQGTRLSFQVAGWGTVEIRIYDAVGRLVRRATLQAGATSRAEWQWDGRADDALPVPSGVYLVRATWAGRVRYMRVTKIR